VRQRASGARDRLGEYRSPDPPLGHRRFRGRSLRHAGHPAPSAA